jgi:hypothetical protein
MATNYPTHPVFSWRPTITGSVTWDDGVTSDSIDLATDVGSTYWGWDSDGSNNASASSIQGRLAALLQAETTATSVAAAYTWPDGDAAPPRTSYTTDVSINLTFSSLAVAAQFGFDSTTPTLTNLAATPATFTDAGHWQPLCRGGSDERWSYNDNVGVTETIDGSSRKLREWGEALTDRAFVFPSVMVANIRSDAAAETSQAAMAQRDTADPNSLLENMAAAARLPENTDDARAFRVYTAAAVYRTCYWLRKEEISAIESVCSNQSARRVWSVAFTMRDDG